MKLEKVKQCILLLSAFLFFELTATSQQITSKPRLIIPFGHQSGIQQTIFSHDNKLLITNDDQITIISDVRSGKPLFYLAGSNASISANDKYVATTLDTLLMVWSTADGSLVHKLNTSSLTMRTEFHPTKEILLIEGKAVKDNTHDEENENACVVTLWDLNNNEPDRFIDKSKQAGIPGYNCETCQQEPCLAYGAWFTQTGDSVRLVYKNIIKTYALGNYTTPKKVCLSIPGKMGIASASPKTINNHIITLQDQDDVFCFNEYGQNIGRWSTKETTVSLFSAVQKTDCISPASNFAATYSNNRITLHDMAAYKNRVFEVKGGNITNLRFNQAGSLVLVEFLDEAPRILSTANFSTPSQLTERDYQGFPTYVFVTKTVPEANEITAIWDSMPTPKPVFNKTQNAITNIFGVKVENPAETMIGGMKRGAKEVFTNSGEIVNLAMNRTISKIQSLIKLSGDITFSPDNRVMLLNTGKSASLYSIPYARLLLNLQSPFATSRFSPDSKWMVQYHPMGKVYIVSLSTGHIDSLPLRLGLSASKYLINFSPDSKQATIATPDSVGYHVIDVVNKKTIRSVTDETFYTSEEATVYGIVNTGKQTVRFFNKKDSTLIYTLSLGKKQTTANYAGLNYRISFSAQSPSVVVWNQATLIYIKDLYHADVDNVKLEGGAGIQGQTLTTIKLSPNGKFVYLQYDNQIASIVNLLDTTQGFTLYEQAGNDMEIGNFGKTMGKMLQSVFSGNSSAFMGAELAQFSQTGDSIMACQGDSAVVYLCATGARLYSIKTTGQIKSFNYHNNLFVSYYYGVLKFYKFPDQQEWFSMIPFKNGENVFLLPDGTFYGSKSATRHLSYIYDAKSLSYKQFDFNNNRPDLVLRALGNTDARYLALYDSSLSIRRRREGLQEKKTLAFETAPEVTITNEKEIIGEVKEKELALKLRIKCVNQYPDRLALFINGNPLGGIDGIRLSHKSFTLDTTVRLTLTPGSNFIEVSAFDVLKQESYRQPLYIQYAPDTVPSFSIYFAGIGADSYKDKGLKKLTYARKDIIDVLDSLKRQHGNNIIVDTLFNKDVTVANLRKLHTKYSHTHPDDIVIVYYSGHGKIDMKKTEAYFGTYDMDNDNPSQNGIAIKDFTYVTENIPCRNKVVFLDACHSGELNKDAWNGQATAANTSGPHQTEAVSATPSASAGDELLQPVETEPFDIVLEMFTDLYQGNGTNIIVSARGLEAAKECDALKHGVFTYAVLKGLEQFKADADSNSILTIGELQTYVTSNVLLFSKECQRNRMQRAAARKENEYNDWALARREGAALVKHSEIKEVVEKTAPAKAIMEGKNELDSLKSFNPVHQLQQGQSPDEMIQNTVDKLRKLNPFKKSGELEKYQKQKSHPNAITLLKEPGFNVQYELMKSGNLVFDINCPGLLPVMQVDVNGNGEADGCTDRTYQKNETSNELSARFVTDKSAASQPCTGQASTATFLNAGDHYLFSISPKELSTIEKKARINFIFYSSNKKEIINYPGSSSDKLFDKTLEVTY